MDVVESVLASPRGRFFCANVAYKCSTDDPEGYYCRPSSPEDVREVIEGVDVRLIAQLSEFDLLDALSFATDWARYWQPPDEEDVMFARPHIVNALRPIAVAVLNSPHAYWWSDPVDLDNQRLVVHPWSNDGWPESTLPYRPLSTGLDVWREHVVAMEERYRLDRVERPDSRVGGEWWSIPSPSSALSTTRAREGLGALELMLEEDSSGGGEARVWPVHVVGEPRMYEISNPTDWARLVDSYPLAVPESKRSDWFETTGEYRQWVIPDWVAVAGDYDAVHLSIHGYLTTPGLAIPLSDSDGATVLGGWDPDATWWLDRTVTTIEDKPTLWRREDGRWTRPQ
ncbi:hypothetical protein [Rhodococcus sp. 1168]|uniref:hypothetical protein n=1 Tax=Rhodococcus sp. 1168 TaxID=2018041 RepID=UPI000A0DF3C8|nr:hypothetical protein [Rhodococcus sp. 1168]ORI26643.1 hypothetical protein BJI47_01565 [Rhodococcus sp. 1168]